MTTRLASVDYQFSKALSMHCFCLFYLLVYIHPSVRDYVCIAGRHSGIRLLGSYYVAPTKADNAIFLVVDVVQHPGDICCVPLQGAPTARGLTTAAGGTGTVRQSERTWAPM